jgi:Mg-chelatase subunit ChlD
MSAFASEVIQNAFLPEGGTDVHAVLSITCTGAPSAGSGDGEEAAEILILDTSSAMQGRRVEAVWQPAVDAVLDEVLDGIWFAVIAGADSAERVFPPVGAAASMARMNPLTRAAARLEIGRVVAGGGSAIGSWLRLAAELFDTVPNARTRHAVMIVASRTARPRRR